MKDALANTLVLGIAATVVGITIGLGIGILAALRPYSKFDTAATTGAFVGFSIPPFVSAVMLQLLFAVYMTKWLGLSKPFLPTSGVYPPGHTGFDPVLRAKHLILPVDRGGHPDHRRLQPLHAHAAHGGQELATTCARPGARASRERAVIVKHGLRNALIPIVTVAAIDIGAIIGGLIITERIFEYKGMGDFFLTALGNGDFPQLMPWLVIVVISVILFNLLADVLYALLDPRIRLE